MKINSIIAIFKKVTACIVLLTSLLAVSAQIHASSKSPFPPDFDAYMEQMRKDWGIPGIAVAFVRGDKLEAVKSYGLRQFDRPEKVDGDTVFGIASITKTFVAGALATLVDQGKIDWDDPIIKHLPDFKLADPWLTKRVTIKDILTHRSGLAYYGDIWEEMPDLTETEAVKMFEHYGFISPFRTRSDYNSLIFIILAEIIKKHTGQHWSDYIRTALWEPMGIDGVYAQPQEFVKAENVLRVGDGWSEEITLGQAGLKPGVNAATAHVMWEPFFEGKVSYDDREFDNTISHFHSSVIDASQSVFASAKAMGHWATLLLNNGALGGKQILSEEAVPIMRRLYSINKDGKWFADVTNNQSAEEIAAGNKRRSTAGYGLGFQLMQYKGHQLFGHSGGELGYASLMSIDPEENFGVVVLVNNSLRAFNSTEAIMNTVLDWQYGYTAADWSRYYIERSIKQQHEYTEMFHGYLNSAEKGTKPSVPVGSIIGTYYHPAVGDFHVKHQDGQLIMTTGKDYVLEVSHWQHDTYRGTVISPLRFNAMLTFGDVKNGVPQSMHVQYLEMQDMNLVFRRK